jgi:hypothetical protein
MKTISFALVSAGLLALTACGGGNKSTNTSTSNSLASDPLANSSTLETDYGSNGLGTTNSLDTNLTTTTNSSSSLGNGSSTTTNTTTTTTNSTTN